MKDNSYETKTHTYIHQAIIQTFQLSKQYYITGFCEERVCQVHSCEEKLN